ncbi:hypothetical protein SEVIR_6G133512v4 [Setaria viridis]
MRWGETTGFSPDPVRRLGAVAAGRPLPRPISPDLPVALSRPPSPPTSPPPPEALSPDLTAAVAEAPPRRSQSPPRSRSRRCLLPRRSALAFSQQAHPPPAAFSPDGRRRRRAPAGRHPGA